jgi:hypothetical protein
VVRGEVRNCRSLLGGKAGIIAKGELLSGGSQNRALQ